MKRILTAAALLLLFAVQSFATPYYVRKDGNDSTCDGTQNEAAGDGTCAWLTVDYAAGQIIAGDVIRVQEGDYNETVTPSVSGSGVDATITFIADDTVTINGFSFSGQDYIRIIGFTIDTTGSRIFFNEDYVSTGIEIWNNIIIGGTGIHTENNLDPADSTTYIENSIIWGNTIYNHSFAIRATCDGCIIGYNEGYGGSNDFMQASFLNSIIQGNYYHDFAGGGAHFDFFQTYNSPQGWQNNLYQNNLVWGIGVLDEHVSSIQKQNAVIDDYYNNVWRFNSYRNLGNGGLSIDRIDDPPATYTIVYNDTAAEMQTSQTGPTKEWVVYAHPMLHGGHGYGKVKNTLLWEAWGPENTQNIEGYYFQGTGNEKDYNFAGDPDGIVTFDSNWTNQAHKVTNGDPDWADWENNLEIGADSEAIGAGGPLTTVSSAGNTGVTFNVVVGEYFRGDYTGFTQYDGNLSVGDIITIGTDVRTISSISGDAITVTSSLTWAQDDEVFFGIDTTPDIGAFPYKVNGYVLSGTYTNSGGTVTVSPNFVDLVRTVVVFEDGLPVGADSISPYEISVGSGTIIARMYPRYASETTYTDATLGGDPVVSSIIIPAAGTTIIIDFNETVTESGDGSDWDTFTMSGGAVTLSSPNVDDDEITYTLSRTVYQGETLTELDYIQPGNGIEDIEDNDLETINNYSGSFANNSTQDGTAPTVSSVIIPDAGTTIIIDFDETVTESGNGSNWNVFKMSGSGASITLSNPNVNDDEITYTMSRTVDEGETLTELDYTQPGNGIEDVANNDLTTIDNYSGSFTNDSSQGGDPATVKGLTMSSLY